MSDQLDLADHFNRVNDGAMNVFTLANLSKWIEQKTRLDGKLFSFLDHEYQRDIIDDPAQTLYVNKAAQTGLSEIFARWGMAACTTQQNFTLIWTFPSTSDAERFTKARLDPFISSSPAIRQVLSKSVNSVELKQFGENSFAYVRGTLSDTGGLSVPADLLIHDEYDKSDMDNIATYVSRLQHKPTKMRRLFSTPTVTRYGISLLCETAKRKKQIWKCSHCNHYFIPSYEHDVVIPGYNGSKKEITKQVLRLLDYRAAKLLCPKCGQEPSPDIQYRSWIIENPNENYEAVGYYVSPFCAPKIITPSYLVRASTEFNKWSEFCNQALGLPAEDSDDSITESDVKSAIVQADLRESTFHCMGVDMGLICHITVGRRDKEGRLIVVHRERVSYRMVEARRRELQKHFKVITSVHDMFPYTDIVSRICDYDSNAFGAVYSDKPSTEAFTVKEQEENPEEGKLNVRQVTINRNTTFDGVMAELKAGLILFSSEEDNDLLSSQLRSMKRIQAVDRFGGIVYKWVKTDGEDHYHHSLAYLKTACDLRAMAGAATVTDPTSIVSSFVIKAHAPKDDRLLRPV